MRSFRTTCSAAVAWVMIPLAAWAGMPSTACVCANGRVKLFCGCQGTVSKTADHGPSACCGRNSAETKPNRVSTYSGAGTCCHGVRSSGPGFAPKACCRTILPALGMAPEATSAPNDETSSLLAIVEGAEVAAPCASHTAAVEFDPGPVLDRVIVFRSLLI